jgi:hypothetical protein
MELTLNLAWLMLTALMCALWVRYVPLKGAGNGYLNRRTQFVALALVLLILFPVISVTDDLVLAQNPAETDSLQRRAHAAENAHSALHPAIDMALQAIAESASESAQFFRRGHLPALKAMAPATGPIQNRPPPVA